MSENENDMSIWDHLDEFRVVAVRVAICLLVVTPVIFLLKGPLFEIILYPSKPDFVLYQGFSAISDSGWYIAASEWLQARVGFGLPDTSVEGMNIDMINTQLASQFIIHLTTSLYVAIIITAPYLIYQLYSFIAPALYENERKHSVGIIIKACVLFACGVLLNYFLIFPLSFRFLSSYQVATEITNMISLSSYISTLLTLSLMMGIVFEIPVLTIILAKLGFINAQMLKQYRKYAFVVTMVVAALITPTGDAVTLFLVTTPMYLLYEFSIRIIK